MPQPTWSLLFAWLALPLAALGILLIRRGRYPKRQGSEPHCRRCEYNLTGIQSQRCPECGAELSPKTIVHGERNRRAGMWITGLVMVLLGIVALMAPLYRWLSRVDWYPYKPTFMLINELGPPMDSALLRALSELRRREQAGKLSVHQQGQLLERALAKPDGQIGEIVRQLNDFAGRQYAAGLMSDQQKAIFFQRGVRPMLFLRPVVVSGDPVPFEVSFYKMIPESWQTRVSNVRVMIDGKLVMTPERMIGLPGGLGGGYSMGWPVQFSMPGEHQMEVVATYELLDERGKVGHRQDRSSSGSFSIIESRPPNDLKIVTDATLAKAIQAGIEPEKFEFNVAGSRVLSGRFWVNRVPTDLAFEVLVRWADHEEKLFGTVAGASGSDGMYRVSSNPMKGSSPPPKIDLILRGTEQAARDSVHVTGVWKGELIYHDVPVNIIPDPVP